MGLVHPNWQGYAQHTYTSVWLTRPEWSTVYHAICINWKTMLVTLLAQSVPALS